MPSFAASPLVGQGGWPMEQDELELESTEDGELVEESLADGHQLAEGDVDWDFWGAVVSGKIHSGRQVSVSEEDHRTSLGR